jgi:deoxycytidylate deaminase
VVKKSLDKKPRTNRRPKDTEVIPNPELVFGIVGPIGVNVEAVMDALSEALKDIQYRPVPIHLTDLIDDRRIKVKRDLSTYYARFQSLIAYANAYRKLAKSSAALAGIAILTIRRLRSQITKDEKSPARGTAYIVRQFKREEEIDLMRRVYGRKFVQVSVFGSAADRRRVMMEKIHRYEPSPKTDAECERQAVELIETDYNQKDDVNGQRVSEVFHLGDVFVNGIDTVMAERTIRRFIKAFFGDTKSSPTKDEYGLYIAGAAALRSADLSRQVGAAIFSKDGEIISLGCNEAPRAGGGNYWTDDEGAIYRDVDIGFDPNQDRKSEIVHDLLTRMGKEKLLSSGLMKLKTAQKQAKLFLASKVLGDSQLMDILEFSRVIHAEMSAISDAARLGRMTKDATLFCTTFPCHICAKHIVAAGIDRVVFLEPYPKSLSQKLHSDSITFETDIPEKVLFEPFIGISPRRYRDIFEKKERKDETGKAKKWYEGSPAPLVEDRSPAYIANEEPALYVSLKGLKKNPSKINAARSAAA